MGAAELIADALARLPACPPDVRKAALLRIARVQRITSPSQARATLEAGLALDPGVAHAPHLGFEQLSRLTVAAVAPERLLEMPPPARGGAIFSDLPFHLARVMREHGHLKYLRTYVLHDASLAEVPFSGIQFLVQSTHDKDEQRALLLRAVEVWRAKRGQHKMDDHQFFSLFRHYWKILPRDEALATLTEIVDKLLAQPDTGVSGRVGDVVFSSTQALELFQYFDILLQLDPARANELPRAHPELTTALERYPEGLRTMEEEAEAERSKMPPPDPNKRGYIMMGGSADFDYGRALFEAEEIKDFAKPLGFATASYHEDTDSTHPNGAPKEFWPSGAKYKSIFLRMGKTLGEAAEEVLPAVPDIDLRLLAQIELAAGLCGLPELSSLTQTRRRHP